MPNESSAYFRSVFMTIVWVGGLRFGHYRLRLGHHWGGSGSRNVLVGRLMVLMEEKAVRVSGSGLSKSSSHGGLFYLCRVTRDREDGKPCEEKTEIANGS